MENHPNWHPTNGRSDSRPVIWKLEGNEVLFMTGAVGASIGLFRYLADQTDLSVLACVILGLSPAAVTLVTILKLVSGKPRSYAADFITWKLSKLRSAIGLFPQPLIQSKSKDDQQTE